jgi:3-hydroxyacyl-CoA dehydrogenase/enoyl-CoA hydratase/3-hydroxybutyryl-CoA epimerase
VLTSTHDANVGSIFGIGFPGWTGGALQFVYGTGIDDFLLRARQLAAHYGPGFAVAPAVEDALRRFEPRW